jgi:tetratricopeptide (TPR) repeat protein
LPQQNYPQAKTPLDRQTAIAQWQAALDQLQQIPGETLAGKSAQQNLTAYQRDFEATVGLAAGNQQTLMVLGTARQYSQRAAQQGQNPPHSAEEWRQIMGLWEDAIAQVELIPSGDVMGYAEAQRMRAEYRQNLGQIEIQLEKEETSARAFQQAQRESEDLFRIADGSNRGQTIAQLSSIINQLKQVSSGTTVYLEAQDLLRSAQNKRDQFNP